MASLDDRLARGAWRASNHGSLFGPLGGVMARIGTEPVLLYFSVCCLHAGCMKVVSS